MRQGGFNPGLGHSPRAFSRPGGSAAKAAGFVPALGHSPRAFSRPGGSAAEAAGFNPALGHSPRAFTRPGGSAAKAAGFVPALGHSPRAFSRPGGSAAKAAGFTLLEMIVVLAILGLAAALVGPSMLRGIDSWRRQAAMDGLLDQLRALPGNARASGKPITLSAATLASPTPPLRIDGDWTLSVPEPWSVGANGVCQGGDVVVANAFGERRVRVAAPFCDPSVQP